jgi:nitrate/TMAO reductase-like tetraheme cytochrome c subunit
MSTKTVLAAIFSSSIFLVGAGVQKAGDAAQGSLPYDRFESPEACASCHTDIAQQYEQTMMFQCFTHPWDEIEYFELALPHSNKLEKVAGIKAGCNGCHAPLAFLAGDIPPKRPSENTRANESVSCEVCHSITGFEGDTPFNFNFLISPGETKQGVRKDAESPVHKVAANPFLHSAEFCGTCHNEKDPWGVWVKSTHLEWKEGPYSKAGILCQDCHMPPAAGNNAPGLGLDRPDVRQHLFHGAHDEGKLTGSVEVRIHSDLRSVSPGDEVRLTATVVNAKAGHMIPSGSAEERVVWLHVQAADTNGNIYTLPVDKKGFDGEEYTIASRSALAYQDIGGIRDVADFPGLRRDGDVPEGDRIFRLPYLDPQGRMTVAQWNTASLGPDLKE